MNDIGDAIADAIAALTEFAFEAEKCVRPLAGLLREAASLVAETLEARKIVESYRVACVAVKCPNKRIRRLALRGKTRRVRKKNLKRIFEGRV